MSHYPRGTTGGNPAAPTSRTENRIGASTATVYRGRQDPTLPIGEEFVVTVDGEPLDYRYDLLSASRSGFGWGYGGSGPAQLAIALLSHALDDEAACEYYQRFKRDVVAELPEEGWVLRAADLYAWHEEVDADA